jgi:ribosomal protein S18 acetylase RimI-like enzyme
MYARMFSSKVNKNKSKLETSLEWHNELSPMLQKQIIATHVASFLDLYRDYSEEQLGLKSGLTKQKWLTNMIEAEIEDIKEGKVLVATISIENSVAGFVTCMPAKPRHDKKDISANNWQDDFTTDIYISLLAVKPTYNPRTKEKIQIGLGRQLIESVEARFTNANALTLDTRLINKPGIAFYQKIGFLTTGRRTFGGSNSEYYTGVEKRVMRPV